jgi:hypothetical protein
MTTGKFSTIAGSNGMFSPRWSPDGRYLAAMSFGGIAKKLLLYDFQAQTWKTWVTDDNGIAYPAWTADGGYVQYEAGSEVRRAKLGDSRPETLFSLKDFHIYNGAMGPWISAAPDNSVMLVRETATQEIYALDVDFP